MASTLLKIKTSVYPFKNPSVYGSDLFRFHGSNGDRFPYNESLEELWLLLWVRRSHSYTAQTISATDIERSASLIIDSSLNALFSLRSGCQVLQVQPLLNLVVIRAA